MIKKGAQAHTTPEYQIKPKQKEKFKPGKAKEMIQEVLNQNLKNQKTYNPDSAQSLSKSIAESVKDKLKELNLPRYKYIVQVSIGEQKGQGVRVGCKCFWDFDTDHCASETFVNDGIFCLCTVYAVYLY
jgi:hydrogenase maturation factor HypE